MLCTHHDAVVSFLNVKLKYLRFFAKLAYLQILKALT